MVRIPPALVMQVVGTFAWLLVGAMARPGAAQEPAPAAAAPSYADVIPYVESAQLPAQPIDFSTWSGRTELTRWVRRSWNRSSASPIRTAGGRCRLDALQRRLGGVLVPSPVPPARRQGWINASDGNMYRLWFFTFGEAFNLGPGRRLPRCLHALHAAEPSPAADYEHPFCAPQQRCHRVANIAGPADAAVEESNGIRDVSFTPRVLLHETQDFSLTAELP